MPACICTARCAREERTSKWTDGAKEKDAGGERRRILDAEKSRLTADWRKREVK